MRQNYKGKNSPKKEMPSKKQEVQSLPSLLNNVGKADGDTIYMVNSQRVDVGATALGREIFVDIRPVGMIHESSTSVNSLLDNQLQDLIDAYATARGYVTGVTVAKVAAYLEASERTLSLITWLHRSQNGTKFTTDTGRNLGATLGSRYQATTPTTVADVANYIGDAASTLTALTDDGALSISNTVWGRDYLSLLSDVKLPRGTVSYIMSMFGVHYAYDEAGSYIVSFMPDYLLSTNNIDVIIAGLDTVMTNLRNADPDLIDIMHFLGFNSELATAIDFARDQRGLTLPIVHDKFMSGAIYNAYIADALAVGDTDIDMFFDTTGVYSPVSSVDAADFDANTVFNMLLVRDKITANYQLELFSDDSPSSSSVYCYPHVPVPDGVTLSGLSGAQVSRIAIVTQTYIYNNGPKLPFGDNIVISEIAPGDFQLGNTGTPSLAVLEPASAFALPTQEWDYYVLAKYADIIMNDVEWRSAIQGLVNSIRPRSITRSE